MRRRFVALLGFAVVAATFPATSQAISFTGIGTLPGGFGSEAHAISADGSVVVGNNASDMGFEAFRWTLGGGMVGLGALPGVSSESTAFGVSADGLVVVGQNTLQGSEAQSFRWTASGGMVGLGFLPGGTGGNGGGLDVSADGSVVVGFSDSAAYPSFEPYRWTEGTGMIGLGVEGFANGVSSDGSVVVGGFPAFRWTQGGGLVDLGFLPGGTGSGANDVSADGSVVVGQSTSASASQGEAFRWTAGGGMVGLGVLPGATGSFALDVSADGSVVVGGSGGAFIWDATNGMRPLRQLLTNGGVDLTGWTLGSAEGISADGLTIVGTGVNPLGLVEGWIAFVPEPGTPLLILIALLALVGRVRQHG